tara:strand:+ start:134 stop:397 length:264 start_codon:yes stop_codon:yes gene_type:complete
MNSIPKILGLIFLAIIAVKMTPVVLGILGGVMSFVLGLGVMFASVAAVGGFIMITAMTALAPLWIPVLLLVGLMVLICRLVRGPTEA